MQATFVRTEEVYAEVKTDTDRYRVYPDGRVFKLNPIERVWSNVRVPFPEVLEAGLQCLRLRS